MHKPTLLSRHSLRQKKSGDDERASSPKERHGGDSPTKRGSRFLKSLVSRGHGRGSSAASSGQASPTATVSELSTQTTQEDFTETQLGSSLPPSESSCSSAHRSEAASDPDVADISLEMDDEASVTHDKVAEPTRAAFIAGTLDSPARESTQLPQEPSFASVDRSDIQDSVAECVLTSPGMKHASYYFADGSIVLSAVHSETKQVVLYRVQTTLLSRHSEVFADMLTMPSPPEAPTYEGAPLVHLPDTAEEIEAMVHCFYDPGRLYHEDVDPASPFWRDAMHMATKYIISSIRARIVASLEKQWPRTLQEWIAHEARKRFLYEEWVRRDDEGRFYDDLVPEPASAIRFARDFDVPSILPAAFYDLLLIDPKNDWDTCRRRGPAQEPSSPLKDGDRTARWDLLSALDFRALMAGREKLWQRFLEFEHSTEMDRHSKYGQAKSCPCVYATTATRHEWVRTSGVLQYFVRVADTAADGSGPAYDIQACKPCYRRIGERARSMREKVWDELAAMFTVDGDAASRGFIDPGSSTLLPETPSS